MQLANDAQQSASKYKKNFFFVANFRHDICHDQRKKSRHHYASFFSLSQVDFPDAQIPKRASMREKKEMLLVFLLLLAVTGTRPQCRYACDDPVVNADCSSVCQPPKCQTECPFALTPGQQALLAPMCRVRCPVSDSEMTTEACPACEVVCAPPPTVPSSRCNILCEVLTCAWQCRLPLHPPPIRCQLACERPTCELPARMVTATKK